ESVPNCPLTQSDHEKLQKYIIQFSSANAATSFYTILNFCNKTVKTNLDFSSIKSDLKDNNVIQDISFGKFYASIGYFEPSNVANLMTLDGILRVERDTMLKTATNHTSCLSIRRNPNPNLDRIDQKYFPLDGIYTCPSSAGTRVKVYIVDTGIKIDHEEFEGRAT
ncbi:11759_t:CDS:2, partial [Cetraspora pellucida]